MSIIVWDICIVALLILLNGFFSGAEMALISLRKTRIAQLAKEGNKRAILAKKTLQEPENFLACVRDVHQEVIPSEMDYFLYTPTVSNDDPE